MKCLYSRSWGCTQPGTMLIGGATKCCLPHAVLHLWLIHGDGDPLDRIKEHDVIAVLPVDELERVLRAAPWDERIRGVLLPETAGYS